MTGFSVYAMGAKQYISPPAGGGAVAYKGSEIIENSSNISQSVTVPADTDCCVVFYGGWRSGGNAVTAISLGGTAMTQIVARGVNNDQQDHFAYWVATSAGSKTFAMTKTADCTEGGIAILVFLSGVHAASPVVDADYTEGFSPAAITLTLTTEADGILLVFCSGYQTSGAFDVEVQSQTNIIESASPYASDYYAAGYKSTAGTSAIAGATLESSYTYAALDAISLRKA